IRGFHVTGVQTCALPILFAGVIGDTVGGVATDWLLKKTGSARLARRSVAIVGLLGCAVFIVPAALTADAFTALACLTGAMFFLRSEERRVGKEWRAAWVR